MTIEEFAAKKAADLAYPSMIAAWWTAVATTLAMMFAAVAVWWARKAAIEASKQARAAIDSVEWSRKAAEAAQGQIKLLEKQLRYSEPRPLVILTSDTTNLNTIFGSIP